MCPCYCACVMCQECSKDTSHCCNYCYMTRWQDSGPQQRRPSVVVGSFMMPLEEQHTRYHQLLERALAEDLTDINRFKVKRAGRKPRTLIPDLLCR